MRIVKSLLPALLIASSLSSLSYATTPDRISGALTSGPTVTLKGNVHHKALAKYDQGPADPALRLGYVTLLTVPTAAQQKALTQLLAEQQDRRSPNYHKWLTAEQWADRFGLSHGDVQKLIDQHTDGPDLGILGDAGVNVLMVNLALDQKFPTAAATTQPAK